VPEANIEAMRDFVLTSGNLRTAILVHDAFGLIRTKLLTDLARKIEHTLAKEDGWVVTVKSFAETPLEKYSEIRWSPKEWVSYGWGISVSPQRDMAKDMIFGLLAPSASNKDANYTNNLAKYPAMQEQSRQELANLLLPTLQSIGHGKFSPWMPCYASLPAEIRNWNASSALLKIAFATGHSVEPELVRGKPMDVFITDLFQAARSAMTPFLASNSIVPASA